MASPNPSHHFRYPNLLPVYIMYIIIFAFVRGRLSGLYNTSKSIFFLCIATGDQVVPGSKLATATQAIYYTAILKTTPSQEPLLQHVGVAFPLPHFIDSINITALQKTSRC